MHFLNMEIPDKYAYSPPPPYDHIIFGLNMLNQGAARFIRDAIRMKRLDECVTRVAMWDTTRLKILNKNTTRVSMQY